MPHETPLISMLAVGLVLAFVLGTIARRLKLSPIVGYLVAGVLVGPYTPGFDADVELAMQLSEVGVILLMFGVGLHFSVEDLMEVKTIAIPGAIAQIAVATAMGWGLAWWLGWPVMQGLVFGLALSCASTVVLLRALEDRRLLDTRRGRIAVGWLIVEDLVMVGALVLLPGLAGALGGEGDGKPVTLGTVTVSLLVTALKVGAFVAVMMIVGRRFIPSALERAAGLGSRELFTLAVLAIALGVAYGSAMLFGVSFALGAFFAGMLLSGDLSHRAASDSLPLRDAFAVLFFVAVGMLFDPAILLERPLEVLATFAIITVGKSVAAYAIVRAFGHPASTALTISASLAQIGEFSFILAGLIEDDSDLVRKARAAEVPTLRGNAADARVLADAYPDTALLAVLAIPDALAAGEISERLRAANPGMTILARAHSDHEVKHLLAHGADGAVLAEKELAHSMAEMALSAPPFRKPRSA